MGIRSLRCSLYLFTCRIKTSVKNVIINRTVEQHCFLRYNTNLLTQGIQRNLADILPINRNTAVSRIVETRQQAGYGRFTRTGRTDKGNHFAGLNLEGNMAEHFFVFVISKAYIIKAYIAFYLRQSLGIRCIFNNLRQIQYVENTLRCSQCLLNIADNTA